MKTIHIHVDNMKCDGCVNTIRKAVLSQPGVQEAHVLLEAGEVTATGDDTMDRDHLVHRLNSLGYPETGNNALLKKAASFVSCAKGRVSGEGEE